MIQGGGFTPDYEKKETRPPIINEADNGLRNTIGTIAMARTSDPHSATAQFFINVNNNSFLDFREFLIDLSNRMVPPAKLEARSDFRNYFAAVRPFAASARRIDSGSVSLTASSNVTFGR